MPTESPVFLTPREAAALNRLLDAYIVTEQADPGMEDLKAVRLKVIRVGQDHTLYVAPTRAVVDPQTFGGDPS